MYALRGLMVRFVQLFAGALKEPGENFSPGVKKIIQLGGRTIYVFSQELVGDMTPGECFSRLGGSGFCTKYSCTLLLGNGSGVISFEGVGGYSCDLPRVIFSKDEARLIVPHNAGPLDWGQIVREIRAIFAKPKVS